MISILVDVSSPTNWSHRLSFFAMVIALFAGFLSRLLLRRLLSPFTRRGTASSCADYARILGLLHLTQLLETRVMFHIPYPTLILHGGIGPVDEFEVSISHSSSFVPGHDVSPVSLCEASESFSQQHHDLATTGSTYSTRQKAPCSGICCQYMEKSGPGLVSLKIHGSSPLYYR